MRLSRASLLYAGPDLLLVCLCALYVVELLYHGVLSVTYPYDLNYGEGYVLSDALHLVRGEPLWADLSEFPMVRSPYPPLYLAVVGLLSSPSPSLLPARAVSLLSALAVGLILVWHARTVRASWAAVAAAAGVWFGSTFVYQWAPLARVDLFGLALSLTSLLLLTGRTTNRRLAVSAVLGGLALLTKQTYLAAPAAVVISLALARDRRALSYALAVATIVGVPTLVMSLATSGRYVDQVIFGNSTNPFDAQKLADFGGLFVALNVVGLGGATAAVIGGWRSLRPGPVAVYLPLAIASAATVGNVSSDVNYFLEPTAAIALAVPLAWRHTARFNRAIVSSLAIIQLAMLFHFPNGFMTHVPPGPAKGSTPTEEDVRVGDYVAATVRDAGATALVELAGFAVLGGSPVWVQPLDLRAEEARGRWAPDLFVRGLREHRWSVVVLTYKFLPDEAMAALEQAYELTEGLASPNGFSYFIYRPKGFDRVS